MTRERCRSCNAEIIWCTTEHTHKSVPVDADPVAGGNVELVEHEYTTPVARVVSTRFTFGRTDLRKSHFATCAQAGAWRRKRGVA